MSGRTPAGGGTQYIIMSPGTARTVPAGLGKSGCLPSSGPRHGRPEAVTPVPPEEANAPQS